MTELLPDASPRPTWPTWIAWGIILAAAILLIVVSAEPQKSERREAASVAASDVQLTILAKCAIGLRALSPATPVTVLVQETDKLARNPDEKLRAAIIVGELLNADAALHRLDSIDAKLSAGMSDDVASLKTIYTTGSDSLSPAQRQHLLDAYGFFGRLALSFKMPDTDPLRASLLAECKRAAGIVAALGVSGTIVVFLGVVLLTIAIVLVSIGTLRTLYVPDPNASSAYLEMFAVYLLVTIALSLAVGRLSHAGRSLLLSWLWTSVPSLLIAIIWGLARGVSWREMRQALGWHSGKGFITEIPLGIAGYIAGIPIICIGFYITSYLMRFTSEMPSHPILGEPTDTPGRILALYLLASFGAPLIEETMFRGALLHHMRRRHGWLLSAAVVAVLFAAIHPQGWTTIPALASIALVLAAIREWRGSIIASVAAHALNNGIVMTLLLAIK
jgi:membrane protease YdiL (CAAX protease family)